jgi:hypothetical protein
MRKNVRNFLLNPIGIAFAVVHWIIVLFAIYGEQHTTPFHPIYEPLLTQILFFVNFLPLILTMIISLPILTLLNENSFSNFFSYAICLLLITFQWLFIGFIFSKLIAKIKPKETILTLK